MYNYEFNQIFTRKLIESTFSLLEYIWNKVTLLYSSNNFYLITLQYYYCTRVMGFHYFIQHFPEGREVKPHNRQ